MQRDLTASERHFIDSLCEKLPPAMAREEIPKLLGGMVSPYTVKYYDLRGEGPSGAYRIGRKVAYMTRSLLEWLVLKLGVKPLGNLKELLGEDAQQRAV